MSSYQGNIIIKNPATPTGPTETGSAPGIWTLNEAMAFTKQGIWPTAGIAASDPYFKYVSLLLHGNGANGAQNNTFIDSSTNNFTVTRNGNATQGSFSPYGSNWSNYFDGTGDELVIANTPANFGSNNFTAECWVMFTTNSIGYQPIMGNHGTGDAQGWVMTTETNNRLYFYYSVNSGSWAASIDTGITPTVGVWTHVAVVRNGSTFTFYVNGVASGTSTNSSAVHSPSGNFRVGRYPYYPGGARTLNGWISNVRLVNGTAVYTGNFTPSTTPLTAVTNTSLLTCQSNRIRDASANNYAITRTGDVRVTNFAPFAPSSAYSTTTNGGSAYLDGSGDYLSLTNPTGLGSNNFTIEFWGFNLSGSGNWGIFSIGATAGADYAGITMNNDGGIFISTTGSSWQYANVGGLTTTADGQWHHYAVVRNGGTLLTFKDGVQIGSVSITGSLTNRNGLYLIGTKSDGTETSGWISDFRIVNGTAVYTSAFTPPTSPLSAVTNTSVLLKMANAAIFDNSMKSNFETVGNAQISTSVKKFGTGSIAFDGTGDYLVYYNAESLGFNVSDFTIELWAYLNNTGTYTPFIRPDDSGSVVEFGYDFSSGQLKLQTRNAAIASITTSMPTGQWVHIAGSRSGTNLRLFINGSQVGTTITNSTDFLGPSGIIRIGGSSFSSSHVINGYIDDLRVTRGYARYTANFTPPTSAFADT